MDNFNALNLWIIVHKQPQCLISDIQFLLISLYIVQPHRDLAREAVRKSMVLLKNGKDPRKPFLPLERKAKRILVAGTHADDLGYQCGGWTATWDGKSGRITIGMECCYLTPILIIDKACS